MDEDFEMESYLNSARAAALIISEEIYEDEGVKPDGKKRPRKAGKGYPIPKL